MKRWLAACALACAVGAAGCGGGGDASGGAASGRATATVLLTDSFREDFAHVWATIYQVELVSESGETVSVFDDATGLEIDLKTLRDASGERFSFLGSASVPAGNYVAVRVTVGDTLRLFRRGATEGESLPVDDSLPRDDAGNAVIRVDFRQPRTLNGEETGAVILDFDLARFVVRNSKILPAVREGDPNGLLNPERHNADHYRGTVSGLSGTAPDLTFTLSRGPRMSVTVTTSAATALYGDGTMADGSRVEVRGTLDLSAGTLVATQIEVLGASAPPEGRPRPRFSGTASDANADAGTFTLTPTLARDCTPTRTTVGVVTTASTRFRADNGATQTAAAFFAALATTPGVTATGTYDATTNTLTATEVKSVDPTEDGGWRPRPDDFRRGSNRQNWGNGVFGR